MIRTSLAVFSTFALAAEAENLEKVPHKCRALALSGGAVKGAFEAGAIHGLMHAGDPKDFAWDVVVGTSIGAINAALIGAWPKNRGIQMSDFLINQWSKIKTDDVYHPFPEGSGPHLSQYDSTNLKHFITDRLKEILDPHHGFYKRTSVGLVNFPSMTYELVDLDKIPLDQVL